MPMLESGNPLCSSDIEPVKEAVTIDVIDPPPSLEVSLKEKLEETRRWQSFGPFILSRLPFFVRESHKDLYEPLVVSIGPYHRGKKTLSAMEAHKPSCLIDFLDRNPKVGVEVYVKKLRELEGRVRRCYSETINLNKDELVEMLLLDGCFLLEFFFKIGTREPHALLNVGWGTKTMIGDLLLFENQIPFFVVEELYSTVTSYDQRELLFLLQPPSIAREDQVKGEIYHLLHLYYQWLIPSRISKSRRSKGSNPSSTNSNSRTIISWALETITRPKKIPYTFMRSIPCATDLHEAGVIFRQKECPSDQFDITFENGVMEIPTIQIDSVWKVLYLNLAAFERTCNTMEYDLMSYVALMDSLINTNKDVVLLESCGIIHNMLLNEDELAVFFNQLGDWSTFDSDQHYFAPVFSNVQRYCNSRWHKYRAKLMHDYFNSPWSVLSVIAAIVLLVLTAVQAIYPIIHH